MDANLRPLTLGEILDRTAQLYRNNFLLFAGIFAFYAGACLILGVLQLGWTWTIQARHTTHAMFGWTLLITLLVGALGFLLLAPAVASISRAVASVHLDQPITIRDAYAKTLPRVGRYLWLMMMTTFLAWFPVIIFYVIGTVAAVRKASGPAVIQHTRTTTTPVAGSAGEATGFVIGVMLVVLVLLLPIVWYGFWMMMRYALAFPASVVEGLTARAAMKRSVRLSKGARGRIFLLFLLIFAVKLVVVGVTQVFIFAAAFKNHGQLSHSMAAISQVIGFFTNTLLGPLGATGVTLFYYDQRVRTEGYDIEWMMAAAGMAAAPQAVIVPDATEPAGPALVGLPGGAASNPPAHEDEG